MKIDELALVSEILTNESIDLGKVDGLYFKDKLLGKIVDQVKFLVENNLKLDVFFIAEKTGVEISYINQILDYKPILFDYEQSVARLKENFIQANIRAVAEEIIQGTYSSNEMIEKMEQEIKNLSDIQKSETVSFFETIMELEDDLKKAEKAFYEGKINGVTSGFKSVDRLTGGFDKGDVTIIAARPAMGKSTFALNMAIEQAKRGIPVLFFSWEMTAKELRNKTIAKYARVNSQKIKNGYYSKEERAKIIKAAAQIESLPIFITTQKNYNPFYYRAEIRKQIRKNNIQAVYFDHIGLTIEGVDPNKEIQRMGKEIKNIAMKEEIPIFIISQLSRTVEKRENKRPLLSDLRDSGTLEQDANKVIFLYRDSYYKKYDTDKKESDIDVAEIIVSKNRNGAVGDTKLGFNLAYSDFMDIDINHY
ncbi:MAG: replicative helicase [Methanothermococcus sp.]|uniref:replicative DNA helicase n=1 Tax=Methanothermococcus sp. TaxID=2614238 RepID=UPI00258D337A|nr:DnaB-like helicase C-terminal domain-containing protein [Methanothermococcus sp.]MDK2790631.1 replicative helicase [Methanothermococcus sp.]